MRTLRKITIDGFKSIEHAELELGDLNVVIGANGSGKSNFIGVFRLLERVLSHNLQVYVGSEQIACCTMVVRRLLPCRSTSGLTRMPMALR